MKERAYKTILIVSIQLILAAMQVFRVGTCLGGIWYTLYYSYFSDLALPFGFYFLLCLSEPDISLLKSWKVKALLVFSAATTCEIGQYLEYYFLGRTFDPIDILMYAIAVLAAAFVDVRILPRLFKFWKPEQT